MVDLVCNIAKAANRNQNQTANKGRFLGTGIRTVTERNIDETHRTESGTYISELKTEINYTDWGSSWVHFGFRIKPFLVHYVSTEQHLIYHHLSIPETSIIYIFLFPKGKCESQKVYLRLASGHGPSDPFHNAPNVRQK